MGCRHRKCVVGSRVECNRTVAEPKDKPRGTSPAVARSPERGTQARDTVRRPCHNRGGCAILFARSIFFPVFTLDAIQPRPTRWDEHKKTSSYVIQQSACTRTWDEYKGLRLMVRAKPPFPQEGCFAPFRFCPSPRRKGVAIWLPKCEATGCDDCSPAPTPSRICNGRSAIALD